MQTLEDRMVPEAYRSRAVLSAWITAMLAILLLAGRAGGEPDATGTLAPDATPATGCRHDEQVCRGATPLCDERVDACVAGSVVLAAGDITSCSKPAPVQYTADILGNRIARHSASVTVAPLGDLVYPAGSRALYAECYDLYWGRYKDRTKAVIGNHDYGFGGRDYGYIDSAGEHFDAHFFDPMFYPEPVAKPGLPPPPQPDPQGYYYAYTLGEGWLVVALDSNCSKFGAQAGGCAAGSPQAQWLREKLTSNTRPCVAAMWHHPRFSHGMHGDNDNERKSGSGGTFDLAPLWNILTAHDVDLLLSGHDHHYERYAKLDEVGKPASDGTRQFVVGTGGRSIRRAKTSRNSATHRVINEFGVLELRLLPDGYEWEFFGGGDESNGWTVDRLDSGWERCNGVRVDAPG